VSDRSALERILTQYVTGVYGVRVTFVGHGNHALSTCAHRTTADNLLACLKALAALEGYADEAEMATAIERGLAAGHVDFAVALYKAS
jgi:hypothetical protein